MERTTKAQCESAFNQLARVAGKRLAESYSDVGGWRLGWAPGGYIIEEIVTVGGGVTHPVTRRRHPAAAFYECCWFAIDAIYATNGVRA